MHTNICTLVVTAYCFTGHVAANGHYPVAYRTCAAPRDVTLGALIEVDGHQWKVTDRTARRYDGRVDLYMGHDVQAARRWGKQKLVVKIITP